MCLLFGILGEASGRVSRHAFGLRALGKFGLSMFSIRVGRVRTMDERDGITGRVGTKFAKQLLSF